MKSYSKDKKYYVYLGRLTKSKNVELLVRTFNQLPEKKLIIIGKGSELSSLKKMARTNILFFEYVSEQEKWKYLTQAKAFVIASRDEDFGIAPVEALSCGVPIIGLDNGGLKETVIPGKTGIL